MPKNPNEKPAAKNTEEGSKEDSQEACSYETSSQEDPKETSQEASSKICCCFQLRPELYISTFKFNKT